MNIENSLPITKNEIERKLICEFRKYIYLSESKRACFIKQNIFYKNQFSSIKRPKIFSFNKKKIHVRLSRCPSFCQNFFCYPVTENYLSPSNYELKFFENFENFLKFDKLILKSYEKIAAFYHFYPKTLEQSEIIDNIYFFIWCFICVLVITKVKNTSYSFSKENNIISIVEIFCEILQKKIKNFYKIISWFINGIEKSNFKQFTKNKPESILQYRKTYCPICFKYLCRQHFYTSYEEVGIKDFLVLKPCFTKISGQRTYFFKKDIKEDFHPNETCPLSSIESFGNECKNWTYVTIMKQKGIEENHIEIFKLMDKNDFYILNCLLSTGSFCNSCFFTRLFNYKYKCVTLQKVILICENENNTYEIDNYLTYEKMGGLILPKLSLEKMKINIVKPKGRTQSKIQIAASNIYATTSAKRKTYIPCNHAGKCTIEICSCIKARGYCEKFCFCSASKCEFAYKGCNCCDGCEILSPYSFRSKCRCLREERECDPDLCKKCKDSGCCGNMRLGNKIYKKTTVGKSLIAPGAGLFALEDIKENELISEYIGEIVEKDELERRSIINMAFERNYGFELTHEFDIDALRCGNELRYINHSSFGYENAYAREKFVRGNTKIALYAKRFIKKGEELYFDYNMKNAAWVCKYNKLYDSASN